MADEKKYETKYTEALQKKNRKKYVTEDGTKVEQWGKHIRVEDKYCAYQVDQDRLKNVQDDLAAAYAVADPEAMEALNRVVAAAKEAMKLPEDTKDMLKEAAGIVRDAVQAFVDAAPYIHEAALELSELEPYIEAELKKTKYAAMTVDEFLSLKDEEAAELWPELLERARKARETKSLPVQKKGGALNSFSMLNDNITNKWIDLSNIFQHLEPDGQLTMAFNGQPLPEGTKYPVRIKNPATYTDKAGELITAPAVDSMVSITYTGELNGRMAKIDKYDQSLFNSVCSLYAAGRKTIRIDEILEHNTQNKGRHFTAKQIDRAILSLRKYAGTRLFIDLSQEVKNKLITLDGEKITGYKIDREMFRYTGNYIQTENGASIYAITIDEEPILLTYAAAKKELITIPVEWLELKGLQATPENIILRDYLAREIHQYLHGYRNNDVINYETLLKQIEVDIKSIDPQKKYRYTEKIQKLLNGFTNKGIIGGYEVRSGEKNEVLGFKIYKPGKTAAGQLPPGNNADK